MDRDLLRDVSRSFYLTIRLLPGRVRETIALGYLLARASDSIADASSAGIERRAEALQELRRGDIGQRILEEMVARQPAGAEAKLLERLPDLLESLEHSADRDLLGEVWESILQGQLFDLVRFAESAAPLSAGELDEYTYHVAGSVGEFWTKLCQRRIANFTFLPLDELAALGVRYGKGLQLVNILRDRAADEAIGRVYVSADRFDAVRARAGEYLLDGVKWVGAVNDGRIRFACLPPARIGLATLERIGPEPQAVKISRGEVYRTLALALPSLWSRP